MRKSYSGIFFFIVIILGSSLIKAQSVGLYNHFTYFFMSADTTDLLLNIAQTQLQFERGNGSMLEAEFTVRKKDRYGLSFCLTYPSLRLEKNEIKHNFGDCILRSDMMIFGDSLRVTGLFLRGDLRIPSGSKEFIPFSCGSLDGGGGLEFRGKTSLFSYRCAATYTLVGERIKEGDFIHRNFFVLALSLSTELGKETTFNFSLFNTRFRGGYSREIYLVSLKRRLSQSISLRTDAALDVGREWERVFNSLFSVGFVYHFSSSRSEGDEL